VLDDGEFVECVVVGRFEGEPASATLTNRRLLVVNERAWRPAVVTVPVEGVVVQGWQDARTASLMLVTDGRQLVVEQINDRPVAIEMAQRIRSRQAGG
jgi:hypothetical protein